MVIEWLNPQITATNLIAQALSSKDFKMTSQANHLKELLILEGKRKKDVQKLKNKYTWGESTHTDLANGT